MSNVVTREPITIVDLVQPRCILSYATAPCAAVLGTTGDHKCFNTRVTCQDSANFAPTETIKLRFVSNVRAAVQYGPAMPVMLSVSTAPLTVNLGGMEPSISALGQREVVTVKLKDFQYADTQTDKYRLQRVSGAAQASAIGYDPEKRGTFWGKWLARNPYYANSTYLLVVREGYAGDAISAMRTRQYVLDRIDGPSGKDSQVTIVAKDLFSLIEQRKAVAPRISQGSLLAGITISATSATLKPTGIGNLEYPTSGLAAIGSEIVSFTRSGDALTIVRAQNNTDAEAHSVDDLVQLCLTYSATAPHDIVYNLLTAYSAVPAAWIPKPTWDSKMAGNSEFYTTVIAKPTPVSDLIGEICEQAGLTLWPDIVANQVLLQPLRAGSTVGRVNDGQWLIGEPSFKRQEAKRISQVWVHYGQLNPLEGQDDRKNYRSTYVTDNGGATLYGTTSIKEIFSRWIAGGGRVTASKTAARISAMFIDPPLEAKFPLHTSKGADLAIADYIDFAPGELQDDTGAQSSSTMAVFELEKDGETVTVRAQSVAFPLVDIGGVDTRQIFIEADTFNVNLRSLYETVWPAPTGSEVIEFIIISGIKVGSSSTGTPAVTTGSWPTMSTLPKLTIQGRIQGHGGDGGQGSGFVGGWTSPGNGGSGGPALEATAPFTVDNSLGQIWGGGGGGCGGGAGFNDGQIENGGGGGGGQGFSPGNGAPGGPGGALYQGNPGSNATTESRGAGGSATHAGGGNGGNGGAPGDGGDSGTPGYITGAGANGAGGNAVQGNANITWTATGDRRGAIT